MFQGKGSTKGANSGVNPHAVSRTIGGTAPQKSAGALFLAAVLSWGATEDGSPNKLSDGHLVSPTQFVAQDHPSPFVVAVRDIIGELRARRLRAGFKIVHRDTEVSREC